MERAAITERLGPQVYLRYFRALRIERPIRKVGTQQQQSVAVLHGCVSRRKADETSHSNVVGIVVFDKFLASEGVHDGRFQLASQLDELCMRVSATRAAKQRHVRRLV